MPVGIRTTLYLREAKKLSKRKHHGMKEFQLFKQHGGKEVILAEMSEVFMERLSVMKEQPKIKQDGPWAKDAELIILE